MSILKSTAAGRYKIISDYFEKNYSEIDKYDGQRKLAYEIIEGKDDYTVIIKPKVHGTIVNILGYSFPCKMIFENHPYVVFEWFTAKDKFDLIDKHFYINCSNYIFRNCTIKEEQEKFLAHNYKHIHLSCIYVEENFFTEILPKYNVISSDFISRMIDNDNTLFIKEYSRDGLLPRTYQYREIGKEELKQAKRYLEDYKY